MQFRVIVITDPQTHKHTNREGRLQYTVPQFSAQCNYDILLLNNCTITDAVYFNCQCLFDITLQHMCPRVPFSTHCYFCYMRMTFQMLYLKLNSKLFADNTNLFSQ